MKLRNNSKKGMTLVETIVAFAIISIILVVALTGFNTIARVSTRAQDINLTTQEIEMLIAQGEASGSVSVTLSITTTDPLSGETVYHEIPGAIQTYEQDGWKLEIFQKSDQGR